MKIAIVDDLKTDRDALAQRLSDYAVKHRLDFDLSRFESGEDFLEQFVPHQFDIVFLDIYMKKLTGMEVAKTIFRTDSQCRIIFLTTSEEFFRQSYSVHAVYYLIKPIVDSEFEQAMEFCNLVSKYPVPTVEIKNNGITFTLPTERIFMIDVCLRKTTVHLRDKVLETTMGFGQLEDALREDKRFILSSRGCLVNLQHIVDITADSFVLSNGEYAPISRRSKKEMQQLWIDHNFQKMGDDLWD